MNQESALVKDQLFSILETIYSETLAALGIATILTLLFLISPRWRASDVFITNLVTIDTLLIAAVAFLSSFMAEGSRFIYWTKKVETDYWKGVEQKDTLAIAYYAQLHSKNVTYLILLPIMAIIPFFLSVILALAALIESFALRSIFTALSLWLTLWAFIVILLAAWRLTIFQRMTIKSEIPRPPGDDEHSTVSIEQARRAVQLVHGELVPLPAVSASSSDEANTIPEPTPCIANFPDQKSCDLFVEAMRPFGLKTKPTGLPPNQSIYKASVTFTIPVPVEQTKFDKPKDSPEQTGT